MKSLISLYEKFASRSIKSYVSEEYKEDDRRALDNIFFDVLGLTPAEREAVYEAVINLVEARLKKAESV